jgi:hypothetical protein
MRFHYQPGWLLGLLWGLCHQTNRYRGWFVMILDDHTAQVDR